MPRCKGSRAALIPAPFGGDSCGSLVRESRRDRERLPDPRPPLPNPRYQTKTGAPVGSPDAPAAVVFVDAATPAERAAGASRREVASASLRARPARDRARQPGRVPESRRGVPQRLLVLESALRSRALPEGRAARGLIASTSSVKLFCEIHDHMRGWILVIDTPYFTKTSTDGHYRLDGVPTSSGAEGLGRRGYGLSVRSSSSINGTLHAGFP